MKKICIVGHFGFGKNLLNGQTIKTKIITAEIQKQFGVDNVICLDLAGGVKKIPRLLFSVPNALSKCDNFIMLPVENGLRFLTPLLCFWNKIFRKRLHYVVIGGWLAKFLSRKKQIKKGLKQFSGVYVETNTMKSALEAQGFTNVVLMPNCKELTPLSKEQLIYPSKPYKLCTFSRVMMEKGIEDAVKAVMEINQKYEATVYTLDIYGPVDNEQWAWFDNLQKSFPEYVKYAGVVPFDKSVDVLKGYYALLFPTRFYTEGVPGTIIDAYAAGVPVISARWQSFNDVIDENVTGIGYEFENIKALTDVLEKVRDGETLNSMKENCIKKAYEFMPQRVIDIMISRFC